MNVIVKKPFEIKIYIRKNYIKVEQKCIKP